MTKCVIRHRSLHDGLFWQTSVSPLFPPRLSVSLCLPGFFNPARFSARPLTRVPHNSLEQNIGIIALNISTLCPLTSHTCRRLTKARILHLTDFEYALFLESLSNMKGRTKGPAGAHHAQVTAGSHTCHGGGPGWWPRRGHAQDDTSGQRSLIGCPSGTVAGHAGSAGESLRILKTVSVSVRVKCDGVAGNDTGDKAETDRQ